MLAGHRWERENNWLGYKCMPLPLGGVESHQWCVGCGCRIADIELLKSRLPIDSDECSLHVSLDLLAGVKGHKPVEAGTPEEYHLRSKDA